MGVGNVTGAEHAGNDEWDIPGLVDEDGYFYVGAGSWNENERLDWATGRSNLEQKEEKGTTESIITSYHASGAT